MPTQARDRDAQLWSCDYCGQQGSFDQARAHEQECRKRQRPGNTNAPNYPTMPPLGTFPPQTQPRARSSPPKLRRFRLLGPGEGQQLEMGDVLACQNLEVFEASQQHVADNDAAAPPGGSIALGQVGIRCIHCLTVNAYNTIYPQIVGDFASCIQMLADRHLTTCTSAPSQVRDICDQAASKRQRDHEQRRQPSQDEERQQIALVDHCRFFCATNGLLEMYPPKSGVVFRDSIYRRAGQAEPYPHQSEPPLSANRGQPPAGTPFHAPPPRAPMMADIAATPLARRSKPGPDYGPGTERRDYMAPPSADRREYPPPGGERDGYPAFQPHPPSAPRGHYPPDNMQERTPIVPRRMEAPESAQAPTPPGNHPDSPYGYPVLPSPYDMPHANFPYFQDMNGAWICRYCSHVHPQHREQGSVWSSPNHSAPPAQFMDQHLSICRSYNQSAPPSYYDPPAPHIPQYGYGPPAGQYGGQYGPPPAWGPPGPPYPPQDAPYPYAHSDHQSPMYPSQDPARDQGPQRTARATRGAPVMVPETSDNEILKSIDILVNSDKEHFGTEFNERESRGQLVLEEDKLLLTDYFYHLMRQLRLCRFSEADRKTRGGKRENILVGYGGLQCVHCSDAPNSRKFFWSNVDRLANSFAEIPGHVLKCRRCPLPVKNALIELKRRHPEQMARLPRGSQKVFFRRMWRRLHDEDPTPDGPAHNKALGKANEENIAPAKKSPSAKPESEKQPGESPGTSSDESAFVIERSTPDAAKALAESAGPPLSPSSRILLAIAEDKEWLSEVDCFIRRNLEVFCATEEDVEIAQQDRKYPVNVGQVGIRCIHCAVTKGGAAARGTAVAFPYSINGIYESVREFQRLHLEGCPQLPESAKTKLAGFKGSASLSSVLRKYYVLAAKALGMHDTPDGIRSGGECVPLGSSAASAFSFHENLRLPKATGEQRSNESGFLRTAVTPLESRKRKTNVSSDSAPSTGSSKKSRDD